MKRNKTCMIFSIICTISFWAFLAFLITIISNKNIEYNLYPIIGCVILSLASAILFSKLDKALDLILTLEQKVDKLESDKRKEKFQNK